MCSCTRCTTAFAPMPSIAPSEPLAGSSKVCLSRPFEVEISQNSRFCRGSVEKEKTIGLAERYASPG